MRIIKHFFNNDNLSEDFSCVYSAINQDNDERVNIKVLSKSNAIELEKVDLIKSEIETLRSAGHPFIVRKLPIFRSEFILNR